MRFHLLDRIDAHQPGKFLRGCKHLTLGEEYLADHFPRFPVMPGVLMLQSLVEAAAWLWRATTNYRPPVVVLREAKNVKYGSFLRPGRRMDVAVDLVEQAADRAAFKAKGTDDAGKATVTAAFTLHGYGLADRGPAGVAAEAKLLESLHSRWAELTGELRAG
jgi:3-hydroxyacyl-[acyl-carrier-protein] dehydratase